MAAILESVRYMWRGKIAAQVTRGVVFTTGIRTSLWGTSSLLETYMQSPAPFVLV